jgi:hypothetical protein
VSDKRLLGVGWDGGDVLRDTIMVRSVLRRFTLRWLSEKRRGGTEISNSVSVPLAYSSASHPRAEADQVTAVEG